MTLTTPYSATFIVGDGETKTFSYLFEEVSPNFISVMVYNSLTGLISTPTYVIDTDQKQVIFGEDTPAPTADETVCIYRNTPNVQDVAFRTLHGYDAQTLENILSKIVAMIQEIKSNYFSTQVLQGDPWQLDLLSSEDDGATVNIDYTAKKLVKGLYFRITSGNLQVSADGTNYITMPKSDDVAEFRQYEQTLPDSTVIRKLQYRVGNQWFDAEANAQYTADEAYALAESVQTTMNAHINNTQNPHQTSMDKLTDTEFSDLQAGQFISYIGGKWKNVSSSSTVSWGAIIGNINDQTDLKARLDGKLNLDGSSTMTGVLKMRATSSFQCAIAPFWDGVGFYKLNSDDSVILIASIETPDGFVPWVTNTYNIGSSLKKWKNLYLGGKLFVSKINNGGDLVVPAVSGTLATKADVDLAANSGSQLYDTGVWYAKMHSETVVPTGAEYNGRKYADFSQTDSGGNPIIVIYEGQSGAWAELATITPPAEYNGYITVTSKIWDIAEQAGQQGGEVLWDYTHKTFTPYPKIVSFENAALTGVSTAPTPTNSSPTNQIVNKDYVDNAIANNGTGRNVGDIFYTMRNDTTLNGAVECNGGTYQTTDFTGGDSIGAQLAAGHVPYMSLSDYATALAADGSVGVFGWDGVGTTAFRVPMLTDIFVETGTAAQVGNYLAPGLPDHSHTLTIPKTQSNNVGNGTTRPNAETTETATTSLASTSNSIYGNSNTVQPNTVRYRAMVQLAISATDEALETCTGVLADVAANTAAIAGADYVVESQLPTAANNYIWYRKYKSGWVEQGGRYDNGGLATDFTATVTFPVTMADTAYTALATASRDSGSGDRAGFTNIFALTTTQLGIGWFHGTASNEKMQYINWEVKGMAA